MNEELKIIIKAVTDGAKQEIDKVKGSLGDLEKTGDKSSKSFGTAMSAMGKAAGIAAGIIVAAFSAIATALVSLGKSTRELRENFAKLNSAFMASGSSAQQAGKTYANLFRFLGDSDKAVETANHLAKLSNSEQEHAEWTTALQGVYATFGDSLPIEGLAESANETAKTSKVTGSLADALNWAGVNEDAFNASLAACNSEQEREALIRNTVNGLYKDAAILYEKNNAEIIAQNEAQARLDITTARLGKTVQPLLTALTNLANVVLTALEPAIRVVANAMTWLVNIFAKAISYVSAFISALTGKSIGKTGEQLTGVGEGISSAVAGTGALTDGLNSATGAAEKLKRVTMGFDELNIVSNPSASSGGGGASSGTGTDAGGGIGDIGGGFALDTNVFDSFSVGEGKIAGFVETIKNKFTELKTNITEWAQLFTPSFEAWGSAFEQVKEPAMNAFKSIGESLSGVWTNTIQPFGSYISTDFVPTVTNSFSENFAPIFADIGTTVLPQFATDFDWMCLQIDKSVDDIVVPAMDELKTVTTDTFDAIGDEWDKSGEDLTNGFTETSNSLKGIWENLYNNILLPIWQAIVDFITEIWDKHLKDLWAEILSFVSKLITAITTVWNNFLAPLINWLITVFAPSIVGAIKSILSVVSTIIGIISGVIKGILQAMGGLLDFITGVFSGNWKKAWEGIKTFFVGIWNSIWSVIKGIINLIIDGINGLWTGIYNVIRGLVNGIGSIAGAIGDMLGKDWHFSMPKEPPRIPKLATGGIVTGETLARIGEGGKKEAVLPLEQNTEWMDMLAAKINGNAPTKIVLMLDKQQLGWANIKSINGITEQTGNLQLKLV